MNAIVDDGCKVRLCWDFEVIWIVFLRQYQEEYVEEIILSEEDFINLGLAELWRFPTFPNSR